MKKRIFGCDQVRATPPWIMEIDEEAGRICEWVATDESLVPVGLGLVCGGEQKKKIAGSQKQGEKIEKTKECTRPRWRRIVCTR